MEFNAVCVVLIDGFICNTEKNLIDSTVPDAHIQSSQNNVDMQQNWNWNREIGIALFAIECVAFDCKHLRAVHRVADLRTTLGALKSLHKMGSPSDLLINRFSYSVYIHAKNLVLLMTV